MADFTPTQGRYLSFIQAYITLHGCPPAESEIAQALCVSPPSVNQMVKTLEKRELISRQPGQPSSLQILIPADKIPAWNAKELQAAPPKPEASVRQAKESGPPACALYVLKVVLTDGPMAERYWHTEISREIEIRGDQTLDDLHWAIFKAYNRDEEHLYEFQFGKRARDPHALKYGLGDDEYLADDTAGDTRDTTLDSLGLNRGRAFYYWFDFGDDWRHQIKVVRIGEAIRKVRYPRITKRVGKAPPQYHYDEE